MCVQVNFYPESKSVSIDGRRFTKEELEKKNRTNVEQSIFYALKEIVKEHKKEVIQSEIDYDDISDLVRSDMFKGDNHSQSLITN